jgi:hypothetical protein
MGTWILDQFSCSDTVLSLHLGIWILDQLVVLILSHGSHTIIELVKEPTLTQQPQPSSSSFPTNHPPGTSSLIIFNKPKTRGWFILKIFWELELEVISKIWAPHCRFTLPAMINYFILFYFIFFLCFHMIFNNLSLVMSMFNLIWININFTDMIRHLLICFFISMLEGREKGSSNLYSSVVIISYNYRKRTHPTTTSPN